MTCRLASSKPSSDLWWNIVNWTIGNKLHWNLNRNSHISIQENAFDNVVWKFPAILSRPQCVQVSYICWCTEMRSFYNKNNLSTISIPIPYQWMTMMKISIFFICRKCNFIVIRWDDYLKFLGFFPRNIPYKLVGRCINISNTGCHCICLSNWFWSVMHRVSR